MNSVLRYLVHTRFQFTWYKFTEASRLFSSVDENTGSIRFGPVQASGFRVQGTGFGVQGSGFRVRGSGFRVQGLSFSSGFRVEGSGFRIEGSGCRVYR